MLTVLLVVHCCPAVPMQANTEALYTHHVKIGIVIHRNMRIGIGSGNLGSGDWFTGELRIKGLKMWLGWLSNIVIWPTETCRHV